MKATTAMILGVFALAPGYTLAEHRHDDRGHHSHDKHCGHKVHYIVTGYHHDNVRTHYQVAKRSERVARPVSRNDYNDVAYGRVVDVEPVYRYYKESVSANSCLQYEPARPGYTSHTGTVLGAVIGTAVGHRIGDSHGDAAVAAVAGGLLGASVGRDIDRRVSYNRALQVEGPCRVKHSEETRRQIVEYKVSYRYNGETYLARMDYDPGEWVKLSVDVTPA